MCQPLEIRQLEVPVFCGLFHNIILQRLPVFCEPGFRRACRPSPKRGSGRGESGSLLCQVCEAVTRRDLLSAAGTREQGMRKRDTKDAEKRPEEIGTETRARERNGGKGWNSAREETTETAERNGAEGGRFVSRNGESTEKTGRQRGEEAGWNAAENVFSKDCGRKNHMASRVCMVCRPGSPGDPGSGRRILSGSVRLSAAAAV